MIDIISELGSVELDNERVTEMLTKVGHKDKSGPVIAMIKLFKDLQPGKGRRIGPFYNLQVVTQYRQRIQIVAKELGWILPIYPDPQNSAKLVKPDKSYYSEILKTVKGDDTEVYYLDIVRNLLPEK